MNKSDFEDSLFFKYLRLLGIQRQSPSFEYLREIVKTQLSKIPFENISKLYFQKHLNLNQLIDFELYLDGIEKYNFGGTCYANNFYLNQLLKWLGFDVKLCGANMKELDVHLVNIVTVDNRDFLIDSGYAAPFIEPLPLDLMQDYSIYSGNDRYILWPQDKNKLHELELYRNGELIHGYKVNPKARNINEFSKVIEDSFKDDSTFMKSLLITRFDSNLFITVHNMTFMEIKGLVLKIHPLESIEQLASVIDNRFGISRTIFLESIKELPMLKDSWS